MKVLKNAMQKIVRLNDCYYTRNEIKEMLENKEIFFFDEHLQVCYETSKYWNDEKQLFFIFLEKGDEIKVEIDEGYYTNVLIKENGKKYLIEL